MVHYTFLMLFLMNDGGVSVEAQSLVGKELSATGIDGSSKSHTADESSVFDVSHR